VETHTLYAVNDDTGQTEWTHTAGGRIDSPPTYYQGTVLFGSRDGWVYCLRASDGTLAWRFKDLPDKLIGAFGQLESAWPVAGSVLVLNDTLYFAAGRSSYLDGGIFVYALNPSTGELLASRSNYGPFTEEDGFPVGGDAGFKNDILVTDGKKLYLRQKAFDLSLADVAPDKHIIPTGGFLDGQPQHRTSWSVTPTISKRIAGDILVSDGSKCYKVEGFPLYANHSYFDPRRNGYTLSAHTVGTPAGSGRRSRATSRERTTGQELWRHHIPITGKAMALAGDVLFVAGEPMKFDDYSYETYVAAYRGELGGRLVAVSATDGTKLAEYELDAAPSWDGIAVAGGRLYISLADGTVQCFDGSAETRKVMPKPLPSAGPDPGT
jgi:outer membrane protein assembly factor BamB